MTARRGGGVAARATPHPGRVDADAVLRALADVPDPEIPAVSIVELGMVGDVVVDPDGIRVELLPTFVGCPALEMIRDSVASRLEALGLPVRVDVSFATPWTTDRISPAGRAKLRASGFAPPPHVRPGRSLPILDGTSAVGTLPIVPDLGSSVAALEDDLEVVPCPYCGSPRTTLENVFGPTQCRSIRHCPDCRQPFEAFKAV
jgi:ring-1,2-phenylacetyl-CoA epoxidase subunit PaaD